MTTPDAIAIIPARGGSKRVPRKNVMPIGGRPLIAYTIDAALQSGCFSQVIVSTEDAEIAAVAAGCGATVHPRPEALGADTATVVQVCTDVLETRRADMGRLPETFCCLYATAALRTAEDIRACRALLEPGVCNYAVALTRYWQNPLQAVVREADGSLRYLWPELVDLRPWQRPDLYVDSGSLYWAVTERFLKDQDFLGPGLRGYTLPRLRAIDIDEPDDVALMEKLLPPGGDS
jgi:N-acylneuraminate cytidylyltransferase